MVSAAARRRVHCRLRDVSETSLRRVETVAYADRTVPRRLRSRAARLTANVFPILGVAPLMGRGFTQEEDEGRAQVAVISYQMWRTRMNGDRSALGRKILLDRRTYEIIGVMPREFEFPLSPGQLDRTELWVPMSFTKDELENPTRWDMSAIARLKPGGDFSAEALTNPNGFSGIDGIFRFLPNGRAERALAVIVVQAGPGQVVSPAPTTFTRPVN